MNTNLSAMFRDTVASGLRRRAISTPSQWATAYRIMPQPFPGKFAFDLMPWTRAMHDSVAPMNIGMKSSQMGYTEAVLNITLFKIDIEGLDCLYILPAKTPDASEFSAARFDTALELSPHLNNLFSNVKNIGHKRAGAANFYIRGSNSRSALKSIPVAFIVFDEVDEMNQDNIPLAEERTSGQVQPQTWKISTPTIPNVKIHGSFLSTTQEHFIFKCQHCGRQTELIYPECLVVIGETKDDPRLKESYLICKECKARLEHENKREWLANGYWVPFGDPEHEARGFYINRLYSVTQPPWKVAHAFFLGQVDKAREQEFFNSTLGVPHIVDGGQIKSFEIDDAICDRRKIDPAPENKIITLGIDQGKYLHYEVDAWHFDKLGNDLNMMAKCEVLTEGKCINFDELDVLMKQWQIMVAVIDAQPDRRMAFEFACRFHGHVKLCFYARGQQGKTITIDPDENQHKIVVDRTSWLDVALNRFHIRSITLPQDISLEYREHLSNIIRHYKVDSNDNSIAEYVKTGPDHFAHARCYSEIALPLAASLTTNQNIRIFL